MKGYIKKHFGTQKNCAEELGVTPQTVYNWVNINPRGILRYAPEILRTKDTTWLQLEGEVLFREYEIRELKDVRAELE